MSDDLIKRSDAIKAVADYFDYSRRFVESILSEVPSTDRPQGEWIEKAISIIDDMQREGIVDYEQAKEFRMRARMKGADDE